MSESRIKICGITSAQDAAACHALGADYLGVIFAESPRQVTVDRAREIRQAVPHAKLVGVFADADLEEVAGVAASCRLDLIQLHGNESPPYCRQLLGRASLPVVKAFRHPNLPGPRDLATYEPVSFFLFDLAKTAANPGKAAHGLWAQAAKAGDAGYRIFLAGRLAPENVREALEQAAPFCVDVCSGVEESPGVKDLDAVRRLLTVVQGCRSSEARRERKGLSGQQRASKGRFGRYGGQYVPETLMACLLELEETYAAARLDPAYQAELSNLLKDYSGRPTPLYLAGNLSEHYGGGAKIYLKREDLNHSGAHKINNCLGQVLLAQRMGKRRVVAETGAGQHGVATATVAARAGLACTVYMGALDIVRQKPNVLRMQLLGAEVVPVSTGSRTLKDATNEAIRDWVTNVANTHYILGSTVGPHPYPTIVRDLQAIIGREAREQILAAEGRLPPHIVACVGGGSNALGIFSAFVHEDGVRLWGVEAGGSAKGHAAALCAGTPGVLHGSFSYLLQNADGQVRLAHSIAPGLDYPGVGPEHSFLKDTQRVTYGQVSDREALKAFSDLSRLEGILPALEPCHALAFTRQLLADLEEEADLVIVNLSGRGDKDIESVEELLKE